MASIKPGRRYCPGWRFVNIPHSTSTVHFTILHNIINFVSPLSDHLTIAQTYQHPTSYTLADQIFQHFQSIYAINLSSSTTWSSLDRTSCLHTPQCTTGILERTPKSKGILTEESRNPSISWAGIVSPAGIDVPACTDESSPHLSIRLRMSEALLWLLWGTPDLPHLKVIGASRARLIFWKRLSGQDASTLPEPVF